MFRYKSKYKKVGVHVSSVGPSSERNITGLHEGPTLKPLDFSVRIGSTPTFLYFDLLTRGWLFALPISLKPYLQIHFGWKS